MTASSHEETQHPYIALLKKGLDVAPKMMGIFWTISLFFGGLIFLLYFHSIRFMPEMDLSASLAILIAAALTGGFSLLLLVILLSPGVFFAWQLKDDHFSNREISKWFALPLVFVVLLFTLGYMMPDRLKSIMGEVPLLLIVAAVAAVIILIMFLLRWWRKDLRKAGTYVLGFGNAVVIFCIVSIILAPPVPCRWEDYVPLYIVGVFNVLVSYTYSKQSQPAARWAGPVRDLDRALCVLALYMVAILFYMGFGNFSGS